MSVSSSSVNLNMRTQVHLVLCRNQIYYSFGAEESIHYSYNFIEIELQSRLHALLKELDLIINDSA